MNTVRQRIREQLLVLLNTARPSNVPEVRRRLWFPGEEDTRATMGLFTAQEPVHRGGGRHGPASLRELTLGVQCKASAQNLDAGEDLVEPMLAWAVQVIAATNLDGLIHDTEEVQTTWTQHKQDLLYVVAMQQWTIRYQTLRADLTATQ